MPRAFHDLHRATAAGPVLLSALLVTAAFPPLSWWPLVFVGFGPVFAATCRGSLLQTFVLGWSCWAVAHVVGTSWLVPVLGRMQGHGTVSSTALFCGYAAWEGVPVGFGVLAVRQALLRLRASGCGAPFLLSAVGAAGAWTVLEKMFPRILPWALGNALVPAAELRQAADLCGGTGLTFLIVLVNTLLVTGVVGHGVGRTHRLAGVAGAVLLLCGLWAYGAARLRTYGDNRPPVHADSQVRIAVVQGALGRAAAGDEEDNWRSWTTYAGLARSETSPGADLLVWPETVLRSYLRFDAAYRARLEGLVRELRRSLLLGALDAPAGRPGEWNAAYLFPAHGSHLPGARGVSHKRDLVPFAEYVPGYPSAAGEGLWRTTGRFLRGRRAGPLRFRPTALREGDDGAPVTLAPLICYEALRSGSYNAGVRSGAGFLVNLSDDGWVEDARVADLHLQAVVLRAVETRRWLVRSSGSGISAFIDPTGEVVRSLPFGQRGVLEERVAVLEGQSHYVRWGDSVVVACATLLAVPLRTRRRV